MLVSASEWASIEETLYLLRSPANARDLLAAIAELDAGKRRGARTSQAMKLVFSGRAWAHYLYWQANDAKLLARSNSLLEECCRQPLRGLGKPEPLGGNLTGWWSRRLNSEHRLIYRVSGTGGAQALEIAQCRYHY